MIKTSATESQPINEDPGFIAHSMITDLMSYLSARTERMTLDRITDDDTDYLPAATGLLDTLIRASCLQAIGDQDDALTELLEGLGPDEDRSDHQQDFYTISSEIRFSHPTIWAIQQDWDSC